MASPSVNEHFRDAGNASNAHDFRARQNHRKLVSYFLQLIHHLRDFFTTCFRPRVPSLAVTTTEDWQPPCAPASAAPEVVGHPVQYHVFISHRGPDSKKIFVDILHRLLTLKGFRTFVDSYDLKEGVSSWPSIEQAIQYAKLYIVVLSSGYTNSIWCMKELEKIMATDNRDIIPVFLDVEPSQFRSRNGGPCVAALHQHLSQSSERQVELWKRNLDKVSVLTGFRLDQTNGFYAQLADRVVSRVAELLEDANPMDVPTEVESSELFRRRCALAEQLLDIPRRDEVLVLTVHGRAGEGKSTLVKGLFNRLRHRFEASCILLDVDENAKSPGGLKKFLERLIKELLKLNQFEVDHVDQARGLLRDRLACIRCLIILDDIGPQEQQLEWLFVGKECLGPGSRVIITSRYKQVLISAQTRWAQTTEIAINLTDDLHTDSRDVAITYNGCDVIHEFIDHLRESFTTCGLTVSVEDDSNPGEGIGVSVNEFFAKIMVVVLSPAYIKSPNCLEKLTGILKTDAKILPIFYRLEEGHEIEMAAELQLTRKGYSMERCKMWMQALQNATSMKDHFFVDLNEPARSGMKVKDIVRHVLNQVDSTTGIVANSPFELQSARRVIDFPVGLAKRMQDLERLLDMNERKDINVGVVGMGGLGKTTLVKSIYNSLRKKFEATCILLDVRARAKQLNGLWELQAKLLKDTLGEDLKVDSIEHGHEVLSKRLEGFSLLLVLDDVDDVKQLKALLVSSTTRARGSRIIVTSRDQNILLRADVHEDKTFAMEGLSATDAETLFCWHAFLRPHAPPSLKDVAHKLIDACQGLPLALEVFGSHVYGEDNIEIWEEALETVRNSGKELFDKLRISFDGLKEDEKTAFLDVACLLIGKDESTVRRFWKSCRMSTETILRVLERKSLVKVDPVEGKIMMHDQIRDLGRYIVEEKQKERPWYRTHVWKQYDASAILDKKNGTDSVRGLQWLSDKMVTWDAAAFSGLSELRILFLSNLSLSGDLGSLSTEIRWLQWHKCELEYLPSDLPLRELAILDLAGSENLKGLWSYALSDEEAPNELKELNLRNCKALLHLPAFETSLKKLQRLDLSGCHKLDRLPSSIGSLKELGFLDLSHCKCIEDLPDALTGLVSLTKIVLDGCESLKRLPEDIGRLTKLMEISLEKTKLVTLPQSFGKLESLVALRMNHCSELAELPTSIGKLSKLRVWFMSHCPRLERLPEEVSELRGLVELRLHNCSKLVRLPRKIGELRKLRTLTLKDNSSLDTLPASIGGLELLDTLEMGSCILTNEGTPRELGNLHSLTKLFVQHNKFCQVPAGFEDFSVLAELEIHHCSNLREAKYFPASLKILDIGDSPCLEILSGLDSLKRLEVLVLCNCVRLERLEGLESLEKLAELNISGCANLRVAPGLNALKSLRKLFLSGSGLIPTLDFMERLPNISTVSMYGSDMPICFKNHMDKEVKNKEYANEPLMRMRIPRACIALLFCCVSHDQGWSDGQHGQHGRYKYAFHTFVEAGVWRKDVRVKVEPLIVNREIDSREQVHVRVLRESEALVRFLQAGDELEIRARSIFQAWRISVSQASMVLIHEEKELDEHLQTISRELKWEALRGRMWTSIIQGSSNRSLRTIAGLDPARDMEICLLKAGPVWRLDVRNSGSIYARRRTLQVELQRLNVVWRPNDKGGKLDSFMIVDNQRKLKDFLCYMIPFTPQEYPLLGDKAIVFEGPCRWFFCMMQFTPREYPLLGEKAIVFEGEHGLSSLALPIPRFGEGCLCVLHMLISSQTSRQNLVHIQSNIPSPHTNVVINVEIEKASEVQISHVQVITRARNHDVYRNVGRDERIYIATNGYTEIKDQIFSQLTKKLTIG